MKYFPLVFLLFCANAFGQYTGIPSQVYAQANTPTVLGIGTQDAIALLQVDHGNLGADEDFSATVGYHLGTLTAATTFTLSDFAAGPYVSTIVIDIVQDSTVRTITWPGEVVTAPSINPASGSVTRVYLETTDGGTTIHAKSDYQENIVTVWHGTALADDTYAGEVITGYVTSGTVTQWNPVYLDSSSHWVVADANGSGTFPVRGIATETKTTGLAITILVDGIFRDDGGTSWTVGGTLFLSDTVGAMTQSAPATTNDTIQTLGFPLSAHVVRFHPSTDYALSP